MSTYRIQAYKGTGLFLNVYGTGTITGRRNVCIWTETTSNDQKWSIDSLGNNVLVRSMNNQNYALNAKTDTWNCDVMTVNTDSYVNFQVVNKNEKLYRIQLVSNTAKYLTAEGTAKNSNVAWAALNTSSDAQVWKVFEVDTSVTPPTPSGSIQTLIATANACLGKNLAECAAYFGVPNPNLEWCAWFVRQCGTKAGMYFGSSNAAAQLTGIKGNFAFAKNAIKVGDLAFIDPKWGSTIRHVGIVVEITSTEIITVEGNMSGNGDLQASYVKNGKYDLNGYSKWFGQIVKYGQNS